MVWISKNNNPTVRRIADESPPDPEWEKIHQFADEVADEMAEAVIEASEAVKENARITQISAGFNNGNINQIQNEFDWNIYRRELGVISALIGSTIIKSGDEMKIHLPPQMRDFEFELTDDLQRWAEVRSDEVIEHMTISSMESFNHGLRDINNENIGSRRQALFLLPLVGLTLRQVNSVNSYRRNLMENGILLDRVVSLTNNTGQEALAYRAERLARYESMQAANHGFTEMVNQGILAGSIAPQLVRKRWVVTPDDRLCEDCMTMEDVEVRVGQDFNTPFGRMREPPLHENCRCTIDYHVI